VNENQNDIVQVDKENWPRTPDGTIDWETVFEDPANGLIPAISEAQKPDMLIDCAAIITEALFSRSSDENIRAGYTGKLASIAITNSSEPFEVVLEQITSFLRSIKDDRIQRAADWVQHKANRSAGAASMDRENEGTSDQDKLSPEHLFTELFCDILDISYQTLWAGVPQQAMDNRKIPFVLAADFALRMQKIVRSEFMPIILPKCRHIISTATRVDEDDREDFLRAKISDQNIRRELLDVWKSTWKTVMLEVDLPAKPKVEKKGMLNSLVKAVQSMSDDERDDALITWQEDVEIAKMQQATVREIWATLAAPSPLYEVPTENDQVLLMNIFTTNPGGIRDQISAISQIAEQSSRIGQAYDIYSSGKDLQLPLLSISYQKPDKFLKGDMILRDMLRGMSKSDKKIALPLIVRYLGDYI